MLKNDFKYICMSYIKLEKNFFAWKQNVKNKILNITNQRSSWWELRNFDFELEVLMVLCLRFLIAWNITNSKDHRRIWTADPLHTVQLPNLLNHIEFVFHKNSRETWTTIFWLISNNNLHLIGNLCFRVSSHEYS